MRHSTQIRDFKFHYVSGGHRIGFRALRGTLSDRSLTLGDESIPFKHVLDTTTRGDRLLLALSEHFKAQGKIRKYSIEQRAIILEPTGLATRTLEMAIDRHCARIEAEQRRQTLVEQGLEHQLRTEQCPVCGATVDLSGLQPTPYVYCPFCESIFADDGRRVTDGGRYRLCDACGMFDRIQGYPEFYFYFLLVVYGFKYRQRFLCDTCAHNLFLKALALNALFLIGLPTALWVKLKSLARREPGFSLLSKANSLARKGRYQEAAVYFDEILRDQPDHPAVLMNQARGHLVAGDRVGGAAVLTRSLSACNHYWPVLQMVRPSGEGGGST